MCERPRIQYRGNVRLRMHMIHIISKIDKMNPLVILTLLCIARLLNMYIDASFIGKIFL